MGTGQLPSTFASMKKTLVQSWTRNSAQTRSPAFNHRAYNSALTTRPSETRLVAVSRTRRKKLKIPVLKVILFIFEKMKQNKT